MIVGDTSGLGIVKSQVELKNIFSADVDATTAIGTLTGQNHRSCSCWYFFQGGVDDLVLRTDNKAVHAVIAIISTRS